MYAYLKSTSHTNKKAKQQNNKILYTYACEYAFLKSTLHTNKKTTKQQNNKTTKSDTRMCTHTSKVLHIKKQNNKIS